ncbi:MAG: hypothetical protein EOO56_01625 [Hymenobacter sp.]|nr:MAG: hypothetical protein EOO56_01625 [Hymenobacter sp.]
MADDGAAGTYVCQLTITSEGLTLAPGGPASAFVAPAARAYEMTKLSAEVAAESAVSKELR